MLVKSQHHKMVNTETRVLGLSSRKLQRQSVSGVHTPEHL